MSSHLGVGDDTGKMKGCFVGKDLVLMWFPKYWNEKEIHAQWNSNDLKSSGISKVGSRIFFTLTMQLTSHHQEMIRFGGCITKPQLSYHHQKMKWFGPCITKSQLKYYANDIREDLDSLAEEEAICINSDIIKSDSSKNMCLLQRWRYSARL